MALRRLAVLTVGGAAGAFGFYLYQAGGDMNVAEKKFQHDTSRLSASIKSELPGKEKEVKTDAKLRAQEVGARIDNAIDDAKSTTQSLAKDANKNFNTAVDTFDKTVEKKAAETKGWFGGLFGGK